MLCLKNIDFTKLIKVDHNYKDIILRHYQKTFHVTPKYIKISVVGPPTERYFTMVIQSPDGKIIGTGKATHKKKAEQLASREAMKYYGILEESSESGFFMQEDGSTASGAHGDNILLESKTGFGTNNKLELESDRIIVENNLNSGTIPFQNFTNSTLEPIVRPSDILISENGALDLEDETDGSLLLNGTDSSSTDAGGRFRFELATDDNININYPNV